MKDQKEVEAFLPLIDHYNLELIHLIDELKRFNNKLTEINERAIQIKSLSQIFVNAYSSLFYDNGVFNHDEFLKKLREYQSTYHAKFDYEKLYTNLLDEK